VEKKSIRIETILSPEVGIILANPVRIQQIIWNLLTNAIKFSPKGSKIEVHYIYSGTAPKRFAQIKVIDQGKGIAAEFLPHIFNRFSQADSTSTRLHGGLGLGLSIVSSLVQLQGGVIKVENSATGTGAIFTVTFPLPASVSAIIQTESGIGKDLEHFGDKQKKELPSLEKYRVLVVDDDEATRESLAIYLRSFGAEVLLTESAEETLKKISQFKPHILVSDIAMPDVDGYELMRRVRALRAKDGGTVPALALTAFNSLDDAKQALDAGFQAHYAKPVEANELARAISKFANKPENSI
jgi:CheY-like chemotaxis protein